MNVETIVCGHRITGGESRFGAYVVLDGDLTSWDCTHLHHTHTAAEKCLARLRREAQAFLDGAEITLVGRANSEAAEPLYEAERDVARPASRFLPAGVGRQSRRYCRPYAAVRPVPDTRVS